MYGWIQKVFKSKVSLPSRCEQEAKTTKKLVSPIRSVSVSPSSASSFSCSSSLLLETTQSKSLKSQAALNSLLRWKLKYDVFVCHSSVNSDAIEAERLVSFLEASPRSLRCFLLNRDTCPGGAFSTELCEAVQNSHLRALLITPHFLLDDWCKYVMYQALAEAPMSNRIIPLIKDLAHLEYPQELRFCYYTDLSKDPDRAYRCVSESVIKYLEELVKKDKMNHCSMDSSNNGLSGEDSLQKDKPMSNLGPTETLIPLKVIKKNKESVSDVDHSPSTVIEDSDEE